MNTPMTFQATSRTSSISNTINLVGIADWIFGNPGPGTIKGPGRDPAFRLPTRPKDSRKQHSNQVGAASSLSGPALIGSVFSGKYQFIGCFN